jgi:uncharacterized protein YgfB (UPF0149 family)
MLGGTVVEEAEWRVFRLTDVSGRFVRELLAGIGVAGRRARRAH